MKVMPFVHRYAFELDVSSRKNVEILGSAWNRLNVETEAEPGFFSDSFVINITEESNIKPLELQNFLNVLFYRFITLCFI